MYEPKSIQSFWGIEVLPKSNTKIPIKSEYYARLTNASLGEISKETKTIINISVTSILIEKLKDGEAPVETNKTVLAVLTPKKCEIVNLSLTFSDLNEVVIENTGENPVYISGQYIPIDEMEEEEDFPEEEEEK